LSALTELNQSIQLNRYNASAYENIGIIYLNGPDPTLANGALPISVELDPDDIGCWYHLGNAFQDFGHARSAMDVSIEVLGCFLRTSTN